MTFDIATAMLVTSLLTLVVGASLLFAALQYPPHLRRTLRIWIGGTALQTLALLAVALVGTKPGIAVLVASNTAYALAYAEMGRAMRIFTGRADASAGPLLLVAAVALGSGLLFAPWMPRYWHLECLPIALLQLAVARRVLRRRDALRPADWLTGLLFVVCAALALSRSAVGFASSLADLDGLRTLVRYAFLTFSSALPILGTIGFVLMCGDRLNEEIGHLAMIDPLTGAHNRRTLAARAQTAIAAALRERRPLALLALDVDHFKRINDEFGHDAGDEALCGLVARMRELLAPEHTLSRIGGEEFAILLPGSDEAAAAAFAARLCRHVAASPLPVDGRLLDLHISAGAAALADHAHDLRTLLRHADHALYAAKRAGRNRVVASSALVAAPAPSA